MANQLFGGPKDCVYGCIGYGDCVNVCEYGAISICDGVARVDPLLCRACKKCINTCPKGLIELLPLYEKKAAVTCKTQQGRIHKKRMQGRLHRLYEVPKGLPRRRGYS